MKSYKMKTWAQFWRCLGRKTYINLKVWAHHTKQPHLNRICIQNEGWPHVRAAGYFSHGA